MAAAGVDYCGQVKTIHRGFCLATLENLTKDWPGSSYLVLKSTPRYFPVKVRSWPSGTSIILGRVLGFIATEGAGSTEPGGDTYLYLVSMTFILMFLFSPRLFRPHFAGQVFQRP